MDTSEMTKGEAEIYKGVDRTYPPQHERLIAGWVPPVVPPEGFKHLVAILGPVTVEGKRAYLWVLDYLNTETAVFASEDHEFDVPWPWVPGFAPQPHDWDAIGIPHLT
ncbi:hypothetical protein [Pseudomonas sp. 2FE]|uniref:hypothetical protein n=1 Tax=Pseudomonas sp. 2FE TaxID=2502190 RepID=UPI002115A6DD|nr:hypothetical protein [Pseudomonas sp. 2FE]